MICPACQIGMCERPTLTHGLCHVCPKCGAWRSPYAIYPQWVNLPGYVGIPAPPEVLHHRYPSEN